MSYIVSTRFTNSTLNQNLKYRNLINGCIYGSPKHMCNKIASEALVFVVEMNNDTNKIAGIGLIRNIPCLKKYYNIYDDCNYNRYVYKGNYHINRDELGRYNQQILDSLEYILFKGKTHMKRGSGFTRIPDKLLNHEKCNKMNIISVIKSIFIDVFGTI